MKLSILDQAPVSSGQSSKEALEESLSLAKAGEKLGYERYWIAEHHDLPGLACSSPEVLLSYIGANTKKIRIGSGAILLPHYKPYKIAETFHTLATLFPDRIDLGLGRAPGGSAEATNALSYNFLQQVYRMPEAVEELLRFIKNDFPDGHAYSGLKATPYPDVPPKPWILGTSQKSALLAAKMGLPYAFGQFMSNKDGIDIVNHYIREFQPTHEWSKNPEVILTVSAVCAETTDKAEDLALSWLVWGLQQEKGQGRGGVPSVDTAKKYVENLDSTELETINKRKENILIGDPMEINRRFIKMREAYQADEIMILTITHSEEDRIESYRLLAEGIGLDRMN